MGVPHESNTGEDGQSSAHAKTVCAGTTIVVAHAEDRCSHSTTDHDLARSLDMSFGYEQRYSLRSDFDRDDFYGQDDDFSELGPDDSASQIGRQLAPEDPRTTPRYREHPGDSLAFQWVNGNAARPYSRLDYTSAPPSRRTSLRSSRLPASTTFVPSKRDRVRYSWQSIHGDEPDRPRIHVIKIVSNTATASAALPGGESFGFSISPGGRRIAVYNSARLFILQTAALPVNISQEYSLRRRPLAVEVVDEGGIVAVLADEHTINVYDLSNHRVVRIKTFKPDFATTAIALSPTGALLAAAYEGGVEVFSLDPDALSTDRRAARTVKMDKLCFSDDGSTLLGTTTRINASATVTISVPVFPGADDDVPTPAELKQAWCTNMLEPVNIVDSSHATFLRTNGRMSNDNLFAWNGAEDTFGILNTQDVAYCNVDFPVSISPPLSTCGGLGAAIHSVPAINEQGDTVGMIVNDRTIRLYVVPHPEDDTTKVEAHSIDHELDDEFGCPFSDMRWVHSSANLPAPKGDPSHVSGRLVIVSPGGVVDPNQPEESVIDSEGGRIILFDFDPQYAGQPGQTFTLTLGKAPPQTLDEQEMDVAQEVALVRRRTVNASQKIIQRTSILGRAASVSRSGSTRLQASNRNHAQTHITQAQGSIERLAPHPSNRSRASRSELTLRSDPLDEIDEESNDSNDPMEEPFDGNNPRSVVSLERAASAATSHRIQRFEERAAETVNARQTGFLPLPEYTEEPNAPLPSRYRALAGLDRPKLVEKSDPVPSPVNPVANDRTRDVLTSQPSLDSIIVGSSADQQIRGASNPSPPDNAFLYRGAQRAYSNAVNPRNSRVNELRAPPPSNYDEVDPVSPIQRSHPGTMDGGPSVSTRGEPSSVSPPSLLSPMMGTQTSPLRERHDMDGQQRLFREEQGRDRREWEARRLLEQEQQDRLRIDELGRHEFDERLLEQPAVDMPASCDDSTHPPRTQLSVPRGLEQPRRTRSTREEIEQRGRVDPRPPHEQEAMEGGTIPLSATSLLTQRLQPLVIEDITQLSRLSNSNFAPVPLESEIDTLPPTPPPKPGPSPIHRSRTLPDLLAATVPLHHPLSPPSLVDIRSPATEPFEHVTLIRSHSVKSAFSRSTPPLTAPASSHSDSRDVSSSLFPINSGYRRHSAHPASGIAHPVTGWYPPAPADPEEEEPYSRHGRFGHLRGRSSLAARPSSAPPTSDRFGGGGGGGRRKRWGFGARKTPRRGSFRREGSLRDGIGGGERKCIVM